ncbi:MAG: DinB family protein [Candidatus Thorarchaeota archaeon SMTZ1-45]|nr:MAG: hypothetical protein AM325_12650 [Candidatus Thorarchaeota archaeon SMTZ1-45]
MVYELLRDAVRRHLDETMPLIEQLRDVDIMSKPISEGREIGEVVLHLIRSLEYYMRGIVESFWEPLPYTLETYNTPEAIIQLAENVFKKVSEYMYFVRLINLKEIFDSFNRSATSAEIILEMLEHSVHHRGQITVYYRLLGIPPKSISYII